MTSVLNSILLSLATGLVSSGFLFICLFKIRPSIEVAEQLVIDKNKKRIYVKVVNKSSFDAMDVEYDLEFCHDKGDHIINIKRIKPNQEFFSVIPKHDKKDEYGKYAYRYGFDYSQLEKDIDVMNSDMYLLFRIKAKHLFSNGAAHVCKEYRREDLIEGNYAFGDSCKIMRA